MADHSSLHIIVCIKPVPDPARWEKLKLDPETMLLNRNEVPAVINALDLNAIEQALAIREGAIAGVDESGKRGAAPRGEGRTSGRAKGSAREGTAGGAKTGAGAMISVLTMAPRAAEEQLREALAMGCDRAYLVSDRAFAGADTLATARCLAAAVRTIAKRDRVDLVFCGGCSADGSTGQVGPQLAELLDMPDLTHVVSLEFIEGSEGSAGRSAGGAEGGGRTLGSRGGRAAGGPGAAGSPGAPIHGVRAACKVEEGTLVMACDLPLVVTFDREANRPRLPDMPGIRRARELPVVTWAAADLGLDPAEVGLAGSPTRMLNVYTQAQGRKGEILSGSAGEMAGTLVSRLLADKVIDGA